MQSGYQQRKMDDVRMQKLTELLQETLRGRGLFENSSHHESMEWERYVERVHRSVYKSEINPRERTEKGFFEWIIDRRDVQTQLDSWLKFRKNASGASRKDNEKAIQYKKQGNNYFKKKNYPASVKSYTESARYSTGNNVNFSIAIANRSAAFFHMCRYNESLRDIELAEKMGYSVEMLWKLHQRAAQSHLKLRQGKLAEASIAKLQKGVESNNTIGAAMRETILKQAKDMSLAACESQNKYENYEPPSTAKKQPRPEDMMEENSIFRFASTAVVCKSSPTGSRYVIAGQAIKKGDVLFVEKPFAWVPVQHGHNGSLCAHCCKPMDESLVPCRGCVDASYCNSSCWNDAWAYHQWECPGYHLGIWQQMGVWHLAFKILLMSMTTTDKVWFNDVQKLVTNIDKQPTTDIFGVAIGSMLLTTYMELCTNFFETVDLKQCLVEKFDDPGMSFDFDISTKRGKKLYVGSMILRHSLQMLGNSYAVVRRVEVSPSLEREIFIGEQQEIAAGAYSSASLLNHSCDPTVTQSFWNNWLIVKAIKDVREGEEIFVCYGPHFKEMPKAERQMYLRSRYCSDCECSACTNPLFDNYMVRFGGLKCPKCSGSAMHSPASDSQRCFDCGTTSKVTCSATLQRAAELCDKGMELSDIEKWKEAIPFFEKSLVIRERYMYKHNVDIVITLEALGNCYAATGNWLKSISYQEKSVAAIEERYGSDSLEVASGLDRTTDRCFQYLRRALCRRSREYRDTFTKTRKYVDRVLAIISLTVGPWNDRYQKVNDKREQLSRMLGQLRI